MNLNTQEPVALLTLPDAHITTRLATMNDLPFIDRLQKLHSKQLGFFPRAQMEGYVSSGWVVVAEEMGAGNWAFGVGEEESKAVGRRPVLPTPNSQSSTPRLLGYCASRDRYLKRDELGAVYQLCVDPSAQLKFVGANLLKSVFERASYGCRLFCCWCAQDLAANHFWESMGFVPLAYRAGSEKRGKDGGARVHIFWQKRIRAGDDTTPWWFPSKTEGGSIREDRIVLPMQPGMHWSDAKPLVLPNAKCRMSNEKQMTAPRAKKVQQPTMMRRQFGPPGATLPAAPAPKVAEPRPKRAKQKADPRLIAAARELRDRWLEQIKDEPLIEQGKYAVGRMIEAKTAKISKASARQLSAKPVKLLAA